MSSSEITILAIILYVASTPYVARLEALGQIASQVIKEQKLDSKHTSILLPSEMGWFLQCLCVRLCLLGVIVWGGEWKWALIMLTGALVYPIVFPPNREALLLPMLKRLDDALGTDSLGAHRRYEPHNLMRPVRAEKEVETRTSVSISQKLNPKTSDRKAGQDLVGEPNRNPLVQQSEKVLSGDEINNVYVSVAREIDSDRLDAAVWQQAMIEAGGEPQMAEKVYMRIRVAKLLNERSAGL